MKISMDCETINNIQPITTHQSPSGSTLKDQAGDQNGGCSMQPTDPQDGAGKAKREPLGEGKEQQVSSLFYDLDEIPPWHVILLYSLQVKSLNLLLP